MIKLMRMRRRSRKSADRRGAAAVEFAMVAPFFFLILAGIIEFGQAFRIQHTLSHACRRGARAAAVDGNLPGDIRRLVQAQCAQMLRVNQADVLVTITADGAPTTDTTLLDEGAVVSVTVSIPFSRAGTGFFGRFMSNATLSSTCTLEHE